VSLCFQEELAKFAEPLANATELLAKATAQRRLLTDCTTCVLASSYYFSPSHNFAS
jgi:hypothetical protein